MEDVEMSNPVPTERTNPAPPTPILMPARPEPIYNERGVIAENYYDLQGLAVLDGIRKAHPLPKASAESLCRALFQAVEIGLLNLNDVLRRAVDNLHDEAVEPVIVKLFWARAFHRVISALSLLPARLNAIMEGGRARSVIRIGDSPAFNAYLATLRHMDVAVGALIRSGRLNLERAIADESLESVQFNFFHLLRICNHETTIWEANLSEVAVPIEIQSYSAFVAADGIRQCVYDRVLKGDTYFTQFRGLHQIPETLGEEANDQCECAILDIRAGRLQRALERLQCVTTLIDAMVMNVPPMADNLATSDYHQIRENLGLTSGSHSVCLHYHMFNDLYQQFSKELIALLTGDDGPQKTEDLIGEATARLEQRRSEDHSAWLLHQIISEGLKMQSYIFHWRQSHLHLPRNNLGGAMTKSLTGSPEAIKAVRNMLASATQRDPMKPVAQARGLVSGRKQAVRGPLTTYLESDESLDGMILAATGAATQQRFHDVQQRLGFFAQRCPFKPPARRTV
jgi:tryptophan 2,3-dioxygenase